MKIDYAHVHHKCGWHEEDILNSQVCGCFYCLSLFPPSEITQYHNESKNCRRGPGKTAVCPQCGIDSALPESTEYELTADLLKAMNQAYFNCKQQSQECPA